MIVIAQLRYALAQCFVFSLKTIVLFVQLRFFAVQAPKVENPPLSDSGKHAKQQNEKSQNVEHAALG